MWQQKYLYGWSIAVLTSILSKNSLKNVLCFFKSSRPEVFCWKIVPKNYLVDEARNFIKKGILAQVFFL